MSSLLLKGWRPGLQTVSLIRAVREFSTVDTLAEAKDVVEALLSGRQVTLRFATNAARERFRHLACELGVEIE